MRSKPKKAVCYCRVCGRISEFTIPVGETALRVRKCDECRMTKKATQGGENFYDEFAKTY